MTDYFREDIRLGSFQGAPRIRSVSPLALAKAGFHFGSDEMIECPWCHVRVSLACIDETSDSIASLHDPECEFNSARSGNIPLSHPGQKEEELLKGFLDHMLETQRQACVDIQRREVGLRQSRSVQIDSGTTAWTDTAWYTLEPDAEVSLSSTIHPILRGAQPEGNTREAAVDLESWEISLGGGGGVRLQTSPEGN